MRCLMIRIIITVSEKTTDLSSSYSKVQSSMVEYHALLAYGHVTWLSATGLQFQKFVHWSGNGS